MSIYKFHIKFIFFRFIILQVCKQRVSSLKILLRFLGNAQSMKEFLYQFLRLKNMRAALKVVSPVLLCWTMTSEVDGGGMAVEVEPSLPYSDGSREAV